MKTTLWTFVESLAKVSWNHKHSNHQIISTFGGPIFPVQQLSSNLARCWLNSANSTATIISGCVLCLLSETIIDLVENWPAGWRRWFNLVSTFINWSDLRKVQFQNTGGHEWNKSTFLERNGLFLQIQWKINIKIIWSDEMWVICRLQKHQKVSAVGGGGLKFVWYIPRSPGPLCFCPFITHLTAENLFPPPV